MFTASEIAVRAWLAGENFLIPWQSQSFGWVPSLVLQNLLLSLDPSPVAPVSRRESCRHHGYHDGASSQDGEGGGVTSGLQALAMKVPAAVCLPIRPRKRGKRGRRRLRVREHKKVCPAWKGRSRWCWGSKDCAFAAALRMRRWNHFGGAGRGSTIWTSSYSGTLELPAQILQDLPLMLK